MYNIIPRKGDFTMKVSFKKICSSYLDYVVLKQKPQSIRSIKSRISAYILPYFENYKIDDITPLVYLEWQKKIENYGFSYKYKKALHYTMVSLFNFSITFFDCPKSNVPSKVGNFKNNDIPKDMKIWDIEEYEKFIREVKEPVYSALFEFMYFTGCRLGEALALTFNDLNDNCIYINKTISKEYINGKRAITTPKTKKSIRKILISNKTKDNIRRLREYYTTKYDNVNNDFFIFGGDSALSPTTIERKKNYYCKLANVKQIRLHDFRHSHASLLLSSGIPIVAIANRLGHADIAMTLNTYSHALPKDEKRVVELLNSIC